MGGSRGGSKRQGRGYGPKNAGAKVPSQGTHRPYWVKASDREVAEVLLADTSLGIKPKLDKAGALDMEVPDSKLVPFLEALAGAPPKSPSLQASQPQSFSFVHLATSERSRLLEALQTLPTGSLNINSDTATTVVVSGTRAGQTPASEGASKDAKAIPGQRGSHAATEPQRDAALSASPRQKGLSSAEGGAASPKVFVPLYAASPDGTETFESPASSAPLASPVPSEKLASPLKGSGARSALAESLGAVPDGGREELAGQQSGARASDSERLGAEGSKGARAPVLGGGEHKGSVSAAEDGHRNENSDPAGQGSRGELERQRLSTPSKETLGGAQKDALGGAQKETSSGAQKDALGGAQKETSSGAQKAALASPQKETSSGARSEASPAKVPIEADAGSL
ncbi:hypothetical protein H632_c14p4, partial [Helicosporidium sp. ATCC 50920]